MKEPTLYKVKRRCCICGAEATRNRGKLAPGEPGIVSITPVIYRGGRIKELTHACPRVEVCERCLVLACTEGWLKSEVRWRALWEALQDSILRTYKLLDAKDGQ
jgi:hypothetical protein